MFQLMPVAVQLQVPGDIKMPPVHHSFAAASPKQLHTRSLVRKIGSKLPLGPAQRIYLQRRMIGDFLTGAEKEKEDSLSDAALWQAPPPVSLADIGWLVQDPGDPGIRIKTHIRPKRKKAKSRRRTIASHYRPASPLLPSPVKPVASAQHHHTTHCCGCQSLTESRLHESILPLSPQAHSTMCSTPEPAVALTSFQTPDPEAMKRITELEDELNKLRQQIAAVVLSQETMKSDNTGVDSASVPEACGASGPVPSCEEGTCVPPLPPTPCAPPPPPPPPPPVLAPTPSVIDLIKQKRAKNGPKQTSGKPGGPPNMADILKGLGTVKLRAIARSPGGTPLRANPRANEGNDPASLIAQALKKKFAAQRLNCSPDANKENSSGFTPSPKRARPRTPNSETPPGPHLLRPGNRKRFKRRSSALALTEVNT